MQNTIINIENVIKCFKDVKAVNGLSLQIHEGEFLALLGPNGAGKTTLMEMIEGIQSPDSGDIKIKGMNWKHNAKELRRLLGISLQETHFIEKFTVRETLNLFASFYSLNKARTDEVIELIGLTEKIGAYTKNLSGGQKQKLALGIAVLNKPEILLLDEPTTGLDPVARRGIWDLLSSLRKETGLTMVLTTHYMEEAEFLCERIVIVDHGSILAQGSVHQLLDKFQSAEKIQFITQNQPNLSALPPEGLISSGNNGKNWELVVTDITSYLPGFLQTAKTHGWNVLSMECKKMTLDDLFLSLTGRSLNE